MLSYVRFGNILGCPHERIPTGIKREHTSSHWRLLESGTDHQRIDGIAGSSAPTATHAQEVLPQQSEAHDGAGQEALAGGRGEPRNFTGNALFWN